VSSKPGVGNPHQQQRLMSLMLAASLWGRALLPNLNNFQILRLDLPNKT
jgi:hypothetical protein